MNDDLFFECCENLLNAVPNEGEEPLNSIEIWHRCEEPKFKWTRFSKELKEFWKNGALNKIGLPQGAQFYKWKKEQAKNL